LKLADKEALYVYLLEHNDFDEFEFDVDESEYLIELIQNDIDKEKGII